MEGGESNFLLIPCPDCGIGILVGARDHQDEMTCCDACRWCGTVGELQEGDTRP